MNPNQTQKMGIASVGNLVLCKAVKLPFAQARVSCMSLLLVVLVLQGGTRINYALGCFIGTLTGAIAALLVSVIFAKWMRKKEKYDKRKNPSDCKKNGGFLIQSLKTFNIKGNYIYKPLK